MRVRTLSRETTVSAPLGKVFDFFSNAENLERLTPGFLQFKILTPLPIEMEAGALIEYRLRLLGVRFRWLTEITVWEPGHRFVDVQRKGPYLLWEHEHSFEAIGNGTTIRDSLRYVVPGGFVEPLLSALFVRRQVERIFEYRERQIKKQFGCRSS